jgi:hypothetical protein
MSVARLFVELVVTPMATLPSLCAEKDESSSDESQDDD